MLIAQMVYRGKTPISSDTGRDMRLLLSPLAHSNLCDLFIRSYLINTGTTLAAKIIHRLTTWLCAVLLSDLLIELRIKATLLWLKRGFSDKWPRVKSAVKTYTAGALLLFQHAYVFMSRSALYRCISSLIADYFYVQVSEHCGATPLCVINRARAYCQD